MFERLHWFIYTLHEYLVCLLNETIAKAKAQAQGVKQQGQNDNHLNVHGGGSSEDPFALAGSILDTLHFIIEGISKFMQRGTKCRRFIIVDKKDLIKELEKLNNHFQTYIDDEMEIVKRKKQESEKKKSQDNDNDNDNENENENKQENAPETEEEEEEELDGRVAVMKEICKDTASILRHVARYKNDRAHHMKMQNLWKKHHSQKYQAHETLEQTRKARQHQEQQHNRQTNPTLYDTREIVLYRDPNKGKNKNNNKNGNNDNDKKGSNRKKSHGGGRGHRKKHQKSKRR